MSSRVDMSIYPFLLPLISLIAGIVCYQYFFGPASDIFLATIALIVALLVFLFLHTLLSIAPWLPILRTIVVGIIFLTTGILVSRQNDLCAKEDWYGHYIDSAQALCVEVLEEPIPKPKTIRLLAEVKAVRYSEGWRPTRGKMQLYIFRNDSMPEYQKGSQWIIPNQLAPIQNSGNPFGFKQADYAARQNIYYQAFLAADRVHFIENNQANEGYIAQSRARILEAIYRNVRDSAAASLVAAVIVNERADLDKELWEDYSRTGVAHIVAISGMHINIFFAVLVVLLFWIGSRKYKWLQYLICVPIIWFYIAITGFPPSAVRAGVMFSIVSLAMIVGRQQVLVNSLLASGFFILFFRPGWLYDVGFQLSFVSVLSIFVFYKPIVGLFDVRHWALRFIWSTVAVSIAVQILLTPILMYYFHQFSIWSVVANVPGAIYSLLFMIGSLVLIVLDLVGINAVWLGDIIRILTDGFHILIRFFSKYSPEFFFKLQLTKSEFWLTMLAIALSSFYFFLKNKKLLIAAGLTLCALSAVFIVNVVGRNKQEHLVVYQAFSKSLIEYIKGSEALIWADPELDHNDRKYNIDPAHIGWSVHRETIMDFKPQLLQFRQQKILLLTRPLATTDSVQDFRVDALIVSKEAGQYVAQWQQTFKPKLIVVDGSFSRSASQRLKEKITAEGIECHAVILDGAYHF